jgi:2-keto-4-pentenoate hydratase/2-oxohepta-3-ene-1,7-dioic acid hydratase in catechol pathway
MTPGPVGRGIQKLRKGGIEMRLGSLRNGGGTRVVAQAADGWVDVGRAASLAEPLATSLRALLAAGPDVIERVREAVGASDVAGRLELDATRLGPPIADPGKVLCIGFNYGEHAAEFGMERPTFPEIFLRFPSTLAGPYDDVPLPAASDHLDLESELAVVIGRRGRNVPRSEALEHVAGYMVFNDFSVRDFQFRGSQWTAGKNFDGTAPCGPLLVTADEVADPGSLAIGSDIDGVSMQSSNTRHMIFDVATLIAEASTFATLLPGDIIATGTPPGVGYKRNPPRFVATGEVVRCWIDGIGELRNRVVPEAEWIARR